MAATTLQQESQDVVVFSLSLWGNRADIAAYLAEALRLLRPGGVVIIVESAGNFMPGTHDVRLKDGLMPMVTASFENFMFTTNQKLFACAGFKPKANKLSFAI